jgi:hypothetical protein
LIFSGVFFNISTASAFVLRDKLNHLNLSGNPVFQFVKTHFSGLSIARR